MSEFRQRARAEVTERSTQCVCVRVCVWSVFGGALSVSVRYRKSVDPKDVHY